MGNSAALALGPGELLISAVGGTEPADLLTPWPGNFLPIGYTHDGTSFGYSLASEPVQVAEEIDDVDEVPTGRGIVLKFVAAEVTAKNLQRAWNGGIITVGSGFVKVQPPDVGQITKYMYGWQSDDGQERWIFPLCLNTGGGDTDRKRGAAKAGIPFELKVLKPPGRPPFDVYMETPARLG